MAKTKISIYEFGPDPDTEFKEGGLLHGFEPATDRSWDNLFDLVDALGIDDDDDYVFMKHRDGRSALVVQKMPGHKFAVEEYDHNAGKIYPEKINGKKIDLDLDCSPGYIRHQVVSGIADLLVTECAIDPDDIFCINVEQEYHVEAGRTKNGGLLTRPEAFLVHVETISDRAKVVVDDKGIVHA